MAYDPPGNFLFTPVGDTPELTGVIKEFHSEWKEKHAEEEDLLLYHYTTPDGLKGILESRSLRCGHAFYFNDPNEINYGTGLILEVLDTIRASESRPEIQEFLDKLKLQVGVTFKTYGFNPFMACFCKSDKLLSQWKSYATGGMGYCIGFKFSDVTRLAKDLEDLSTARQPVLRRVIYQEEEQRELISRYINMVVEGAKISLDSGTHRRARWEDVVPVMAIQAVNHLIDMIVSFKHHEYKEENEWRMVWTTIDYFLPEQVVIRNNNQRLTPYRPAYLFDYDENHSPSFPIRSICFGPAQEPLLAKLTLDMLTRRCEADQHPIKVVRTEIDIKEPGYELRWP